MEQKYISIIFDDGPSAPMCEMVDKIASFGWKAGFAIIGRKINDQTESILQYAIDKGFELVTHGWQHVHLTKLETKEEIIDEMMRPVTEVKNRVGYDIKMGRLPFINFNDNVLNIMTELNLPLLGQGIDGGNDWSKDTTSEIVSSAVLNSVSDGAIACLHVSEITNEALDIILPELKKRGYSLVTPQEIFEIKKINNIPLGINIENVKLPS